MSRKKSSTTSGNLKSLSKLILRIFEENPSQSYNHKQISRRVGASNEEARQLVEQVLHALADEGRIKNMGKGKFTGKSSGSKLILGKLELTKKGSGYVLQEHGEDVYISPMNLSTAMDGDLVKVVVRKKRRRPEGKIVEVVERRHTHVSGRITFIGSRAHLVMTDPRLQFTVELVQTLAAQHGDKVVVRIIDWGSDTRAPRGEVTEVLGREGSIDAEMKALLIEKGISYTFPDEVLNESHEISEIFTKEDIASRRDMREVPTFTIDPEDAKDFDDALSVEKLEDGMVRIGVHIADVSHYVKPDSYLDKEARQRGNSVYLVDRVIPMLPERLSNFLCSLRPGEDKAAFSVLFDMDEKGKVKQTWFGRTMIHSDQRYAYEQAQEVIVNKGKGERSTDELVWVCHKLAKKLRKDRLNHGALNIVSSELRFELDEQGHPIGTKKKHTAEANWLIEEFMLLANKSVAKYLSIKPKNRKPDAIVYRVHDLPDESKIEELNRYLELMHHHIDTSSSRAISKSANKVLTALEGSPEYDVVMGLVVRSMAKAIYSTDNIGHYGLAFDYYSHFTSPIRRYADLLVHRLLQAKLDDRSYPSENTAGICKHISATERNAVEAERDSSKFFQAYFLQERVGEEFQGTIVGLTEWGMFVELDENHCEGMISLRSLSGDYYYFDDLKKEVLGQSSGRIFKLGDKLLVTVDRVDISRKQIDLALVGSKKSGTKPHHKKGKKRSR